MKRYSDNKEIEMKYYYEKSNKVLTQRSVQTVFGEEIIDLTRSDQNSMGLYCAYNLKYDYNPYSHKMDAGRVWTKYSNDSDLLAGNASALSADYEYPAYFYEGTVVEMSDSEKQRFLPEARKAVNKETAEQMMPLVGASMALAYNSYSLSDSASGLVDNFSASDSDVLDIYWRMCCNKTTDDDFPTPTLTSMTMVADVVQAVDLTQLDFSGLPTTDPGVVGKLWVHNGDLKVSI